MCQNDNPCFPLLEKKNDGPRALRFLGPSVFDAAFEWDPFYGKHAPTPKTRRSSTPKELKVARAEHAPLKDGSVDGAIKGVDQGHTAPGYSA